MSSPKPAPVHTYQHYQRKLGKQRKADEGKHQSTDVDPRTVLLLLRLPSKRDAGMNGNPNARPTPKEHQKTRAQDNNGVNVERA